MNKLTEPLPRLLHAPLARALETFPVVVVTGARQTGKTTLVTTEAIGAGRAYRTLDDFDVHERALRQPEQLVRESERMTLDEVQRAPELLRAIKREVDGDRRPGRYLLTGSANLLMMRRVSESLAGRAVYLHLGPMTESEKAGRGGSAPWAALLAASGVDEAAKTVGASGAAFDWRAAAMAGGLPPAALGPTGEARTLWLDAYVRTYLERDLSDVAGIASLGDFRRLMKLASLRIGQLVNQSELARDAALSQPTAHRFLNLLETSFQIVRLAPYATSRTKRLVKTPKLYWSDTAVGAFLAKRATLDSDAGAFLENLVLSDLAAWIETVTPRPEIAFWRTRAGGEVDIVVESGPRLLPVEVKSSVRLRLDELRGLTEFLAEHAKRAPWGLVVYDGDEVVRLSDTILAAPVGSLLGG